ncbi:YcgL domain-containing protein [Providencia huaxiensis]|uniref:YcgL domain-containing protein n=1 Tax=Providencia TaxID=586 RepID=UPI002349B3FB|nr:MULTISPECIES: YcgL domain-containing protein [Providencia]ELR5055663.1 YcgL domain-containing protein [Providencia rettgeri]ELR5084988.1 YcgL domain-containing protein [Providencia rettgeri]ELR5107394.1 YcgL domain-containing protein [Providencia rettgeri]ELR5282347.1 YcgL domain-containing protein [Providencia rettgeri]ELY3854455.1 YcgL domain-containing protein [Providencia rettgeri]
MICAIYRSPKREQTYLYIEKKDDFSRVPEDLLAQFGTPQFAMLIALDKRDRLANADLARVKADLIDVGYYLQFPPPVENLLSEHNELNN